MPQQTPNQMDAAVNAMDAAYDLLLEAVVAVLREPARGALFVEFKHRLDAFSASCDHAQELICAAAARVAVGAEFDVAPPASVSARLDDLLRSAQAVVQGLQGQTAAGDQLQDKDKEDNDLPPPPVVTVAQEEAGDTKEADLPAPALPVVAMAEENKEN